MQTIRLTLSMPDAKQLRQLLVSSPDSFPDILEDLREAIESADEKERFSRCLNTPEEWERK